MKHTYTYHIMFPYSKFIKHPEYYAMNDLIKDKDLSPEDIENIWGIEFLYPTGKPHSWYEANNWWSNDALYDEFKTVDGCVDYEQPALLKGKPLKLDTIYTFECVEDDEIHGRWCYRLIKSRICGVKGWTNLEW